MSAQPPTRLSSTKVGDIDVAYRASGTGDLVVLVHGLAQDHRMWAHQQDRLEGVSTCAYDVRGHGGTSLGDADGTLAQLGGDLIGLLEQLGPARCVGFSLGGCVALWAASERPELVSAVAAVATSSVVGSTAAEFFNERIELFSGDDDAAVRDALLADTRAQLAGDEVDPARVTDARIEAIGDRRGYLNGARAMAAIREEPLNDRLTRVPAPVLAVVGEHDAFCPRRAAEIMLEYLPNAEIEEIAGVGHLLTDEDPEAVTEVLAKWLERSSA